MYIQTSVDFNNIKDKLILLSYSLETNSKLNLLDQHLWSENFLSEFLSIVYNASFENLNIGCSNFPGGDLVDHNKKIVVQVSTNISKDKLNSTVDKISKEAIISTYEIWFVALVLKSPRNINNKVKYINIPNLLKDIQNFPSDKINKISILCDRELKVTSTKNKNFSDITRIINILSSTQMSSDFTSDAQAFKIQEKIEYNKLEDLQSYINEFLVYEGKIKSIYDEYDRDSTNKSSVVLSYINSKFTRVKSSTLKPKELFFKLLDELKNDVITSADYKQQTIEDLEFYLGIILVDAFVKCRIFDKPQENRSHIC